MRVSTTLWLTSGQVSSQAESRRRAEDAAHAGDDARSDAFFGKSANLLIDRAVHGRISGVQADDALSGAYLNDDSSQHQGFISKEESREKWGDKFDTYYKKISEACEAVVGKAIVYDGEPIVAAFHAICSGQTESAQVVWGKDLPYLQSVQSTGDRLSPDYASTLSLTKDQFSTMAKKLGEVSLEDDASKWFASPETSKAGTVTAITIGGQKVTGQQVREAFGLRSACFTLEYKNDRFTFHVRGYGHCVGMSQYGADYMARQGSSWEEIVQHYYKGAEIKEL